MTSSSLGAVAQALDQLGSQLRGVDRELEDIVSALRACESRAAQLESAAAQEAARQIAAAAEAATAAIASWHADFHTRSGELAARIRA